MRILTLALLLCGTTLAYSQTETSNESKKDSCQPLIQKYCPQAARGPEMLKCLTENEKEASPDCQQTIQKMSQFMKRMSGGGGGFDSFGGMGIGGPNVPTFQYHGVTSQEPKTTNLDHHRFNLSAPIFSNEVDSYSAMASYSSTRFSENIVLSESNTRLANDFYKFDVGGQFSRKLEGQRNAGIRFNIGTATDQPLVHVKDLTFNLNLTYGYPLEGQNHLVWFVYISNNSPILNYFPIPGFIYIFRKEKVFGLLGIPLASIQWMPTDLWTLSFSAFGPTINTELAYGYRGFAQGFLGASWLQQTFLREARTRDEDRIYFQEKRFFAGVKSPLSAKLNAELQGGYIFDRFVHEGSRFNKKEGGEASFGNSWFASWSFRYMF